MSFEQAISGLDAGDFTRLDPLFEGGLEAQVVAWHRQGLFDSNQRALDQALACAAFNGRTEVAGYLLDAGADPAAENGTGMSAFHWAANRGQLETVHLFLVRGAPLEILNCYGGTVLDCTVWSAVNETKPLHPQVIEALLKAGADVHAADFPSGSDEIDGILRRFGA